LAGWLVADGLPTYPVNFYYDATSAHHNIGNKQLIHRMWFGK